MGKRALNNPTLVLDNANSGSNTAVYQCKGPGPYAIQVVNNGGGAGSVDLMGSIMPTDAGPFYNVGANAAATGTIATTVAATGAISHIVDKPLKWIEVDPGNVSAGSVDVYISEPDYS